jgi:hypothetical protein
VALPDLPRTAAASYRELVDLDGAQSVRWVPAPRTAVGLDLEEIDLAILDLVASLRHVLASQLHRRFNSRRALSTTQRRLKRLADAGLLERFQFHRRDGGGGPMCCVITPSGLRELAARDRLPGALFDEASATAPGRPKGERGLRQARHELHVSGWVLALAGVIGHSACRLRGPELCVVSPPRSGSGSSAALAPAHLRLPGGRVAHDFLTTTGGEACEVERFARVRPDALLEATGGDPVTVDLLIEFDDRHGTAASIAKLERYDHFLTGWSAHTARYGRRQRAVPIVVFVCRSRARARECARAADAVLRACRAYAGEYPHDWEYTARTRTYFAAERDLHEGCMGAYGLPVLPPLVRITAACGDPAAGHVGVEPRNLPVQLRAPEPSRGTAASKMG